ncbi:hypothetical protein EVAR_64252_1 [Eumeta japonica]|uniref:Uncharacterized protein n=1 Tax=Eumeta variegata TaxID=151549 RepID=A0A4C1YSX8_EUMVA|nr:hypothetical protein EVAR_64252_1 [Eumeta japonica]
MFGLVVISDTSLLAEFKCIVMERGGGVSLELSEQALVCIDEDHKYRPETASVRVASDIPKLTRFGDATTRGDAAGLTRRRAPSSGMTDVARRHGSSSAHPDRYFYSTRCIWRSPVARSSVSRNEKGLRLIRFRCLIPSAASTFNILRVGPSPAPRRRSGPSLNFGKHPVESDLSIGRAESKMKFMTIKTISFGIAGAGGWL